MRACLAALVLFPSLALSQVPQRLGYQGRLLKADGTPHTGVVAVTFALFATEKATTPLWSEDQSLGLTDGFYSTFLGDVKTLPAKIFDGSELFLEVSSGGKVLSPRQRIASVAYAVLATDAKNVVGGTVNATQVSINGTTVIDPSGKLVGPAASAAAAHTHPASDVVSGTLALPRIPAGPGSGLDADKLDGLDSTTFSQKAELAAPGTANNPANPVDWTRLKGIPAGFADGADDGLAAVAHDGTLNGTGASGSPLSVKLGASAGTVAAGDHSHPGLGVPPGAVMFFMLSACPTGWTELNIARGRYLVGLPAGGTLSGTVGAALGNREERPVGQHTHPHSDMGHTHAVSDPGHSHFSAGAYGTVFGGATPYNYVVQSMTATTTAATGIGIVGSGANITIGAAGAVGGTNAPYVQLLVCTKD